MTAPNFLVLPTHWLRVESTALRRPKLTTLPSTLTASFPVAAPLINFEDRRSEHSTSTGTERRQFTNSHASLSPDARELAEAIDRYKVNNRRRYITFEEMLHVITQLGYAKQA
jgi:hypothetical protein